MRNVTVRQVFRKAMKVVFLRVPRLGRVLEERDKLRQQVRLLSAGASVAVAQPAQSKASPNLVGLSKFIKFGSLVFDIGAFEGFKTLEYLELGASVVCFEPNRESGKVLQEKFKHNPHVRIELCGLSDREGAFLFHPASVRAQSTFSEDLVTAGVPWFPPDQWSSTPYEVKTTTVDRMVEKYGMPDFVKIDVEGLESSVLRGMRAARPQSLSFEFYPTFPKKYLECLRLLQDFGYSRFNYIINGLVPHQESDESRFDDWVTYEELLLPARFGFQTSPSVISSSSPQR